MAEKPGRCSGCRRHYTDQVFNVDEFVKQNMTGLKYGANKRGESTDGVIEKSRSRHATWLAEQGYENCERPGCKKAIKPA